jgi:hypothetical protein
MRRRVRDRPADGGLLTNSQVARWVTMVNGEYDSRPEFSPDDFVRGHDAHPYGRRGRLLVVLGWSALVQATLTFVELSRTPA